MKHHSFSKLSELVEYLNQVQQDREQQGLGDLDLYSDSSLDDGVSLKVFVGIHNLQESEEASLMGQGSHHVSHEEEESGGQQAMVFAHLI